VKTERNSKSILVMICKQQPIYFWRLYVVYPKGSPFWIIKTNPYDHTCVQEITRSDHAQLTTKMIVGTIKRELAEHMTLIIKTICALLRVKFSDVNPSCSKIWQGREEAIAQIFEKVGRVRMVYYLDYSMSFNQQILK
jgi:hypothetical protein